MADHYATDDAVLYLAVWESTAVGAVAIRVQPDGTAELKRMYVIPEGRGQGLARRILAALEADARAAGRTSMVLETGDRQPEAIALYLSSGYTPCGKFGHYRTYDSSRCYAKPLLEGGAV